MTRMRGLRDGVMVEFTHEDLGKQPDGGYGCRFGGLEGSPQDFFVPERAGSPERRLAREMGWLMVQGFGPASIQCFDGHAWGAVMGARGK